MKKHLSFLLIIVLLFITPGIALAIGEQPCDQWNLLGDVQSEKEMEGQLFNIVGLGTKAAVLGAVATGGEPFFMVVAGAGFVSTGLAQIARPENAIWENWPMGRYVFHHVPPDKFIDQLSLGERAKAGAGEFIANMIFNISKTITRVSINATVLAFHTDIVSGMVGWVSEGVASIFAPGDDFTKLLMTIGLILLLMYISFRLLRGQAMGALNATLVAALAVGCVFFFTTNAQQIIAGVSRASDSLAGAFLGAVGEYTTQGQNVNIDDPVDRGLVLAGQTVWQGIVAKPWALAMFGTADESRLLLTQSEYEVLDKTVFPGVSQAKIKPGMRIDTLFLGCGSKDGRNAVAEALGRPNAKLLWVPRWVMKGKEVDHGAHPGSVVGLSPDSVGTHIMTAGFTLLPSLGFAILAGTVALSILVCQVALAALLLVLPMALFAMMIPETGWALATSYFKMTAGFFMVKLIYGLYLSLVLIIATGFARAVMG
ncbi:hypothetical protein [Desulfoscipio geothermicus]|uniref:TrbL/VirB6 plasmid conjugal transfer protein n=1 Tax=Desulfoscipio geothermicus DSM 3669 TaxID=1121426 RepID=A0A1I6DNV5_9FIRM|nr:hypothetical protein [Desulfoscipio geothermicus]SFR07062.1 hypothetical protein SAMN05660706_11432 [Desulfoscipio geothermicus DSM 3669]